MESTYPDSSLPAPPLRRRSRGERLAAPARILWHWAISNVHNLYEIGRVFDFMRKLGPGLVDEDHPWVTGISPHSGEVVWWNNVVYRSPRRLAGTEPDDKIVARLGHFLRSMTRKSVPDDPGLPHGPRRRMPHTVNYIHGTIHFNGGWLLFDDIPDIVYHMTDPAFVREVLRFAREERRELFFVLRQKEYDPEDYAFCVACVRGNLRWYANGNGPTPRKVLWGTSSPYAVINPINGAWVRDLNHLRAGRRDQVVRPPIERGRYFRDEYRGWRRDFIWSERFHAWVMYYMIRVRGFQGNLVFSWRHRIEPRKFAEHRQGHTEENRHVHRVSHPFRRRPRRRPEAADAPADAAPGGDRRPRTSVIIPALNEEADVAACIEHVRALDPEAEILVVDGESRDGTVAAAREAGATVLECRRGRGRQCNAGAAAARGEVLVFLHADSRLPDDAFELLRLHFPVPAADDGDAWQAARFRLAYDRRQWFLDFCAPWTRFESILTSFGDMGIVARRPFFEALGGFPDWSLCEDMCFFQKARRAARVHVLPACVTTSARRFAAGGYVRQMARNVGFMAQYLLGVSPETLARKYAATDPERSPLVQ
jgi:rSAM/selenodomain-associated transferase 2